MTTINNPLDFELPLVELEMELERLQDEIATGDHSKRDEYQKFEKKVAKVRQDIYGKLTPYQRVQLSRHFDRPFTLDYLRYMTEGFVEFHGDRQFRDDPAIVGGTGRIGSIRAVFVGHQRGRTTAERVRRNFGMPQPEGYRKALRMFEMAEKFEIPVITFIDTQGAYPGLEAEERGQAEAIARNLLVLAELNVPVVTVVIGEGGSGGALALGVGDRILMMENACYSVITPEGCASILWGRDTSEVSEYAKVAADSLKLTADKLHGFGIVEEVVTEPVGGAHRNHKEAAERLQNAILRQLGEISELTVEEMLEARYQKFRKIGQFTGDN